MSKVCVIEDCRSIFHTKSHLTYHKFPLSNHQLLKSWLNVIPQLFSSITPTTYICSKHFTSDSFHVHAKNLKCLKEDAIPTLFGEAFRQNTLENDIKEEFTEIGKDGNQGVIGSTNDVKHESLNQDHNYVTQNVPEVPTQHENPPLFSTYRDQNPFPFIKKCRFCLVLDLDMLPMNRIRIVGANGLSISLTNLVQKYVPFKIYKDDHKPSNVCNSCILFLCQSHNFFEMCVRNNKLMENVLTKSSFFNNNLRDNPNIIIEEEHSEPITTNIDSDIDIKEHFLDEFEEPETIEINSSDEEIIEDSQKNVECSSNAVDLQTIDTYEQYDKPQFVQINSSDECMEFCDNEDCVDQESESEEFLSPNMNKDSLISKIKAEKEKILSKKTPRAFNEVVRSKAQKMLQKILGKKERELLKRCKSTPVKTCCICKTQLGNLDDILSHYEGNHLHNDICIICGRNFELRTQAWMKTHLKRHRKYELWCDKCKIYLRSAADKKDHIEKGHKDPRTCEICGKVFRSRWKKDCHMVQHTKVKNHQCSICGKSFAYSNGLTKHFYEIHKGRKYMCPECDQPFTYIWYLRRHTEKVHKKKLTDYPNYRKVKFFNELPQRTRRLPVKIGSLTCTVCSEKFTSKRRFLVHMKNCHQDVPVCRYCGMQFDGKEALQSHLSSSHLRHKCEICQQEFPFPSVLKIHMVSVHDKNGSKYTCEICGKSYTTKQSLEPHLKIHTGERPNVCEICGKSFTQAAHLRVHMYQHTGKPLKCDLCSKRFVFPSHLATHRRIHTGEKPFECPKCGRKFHDAINMRRHVELHNGKRRNVKKRQPAVVTEKLPKIQKYVKVKTLKPSDDFVELPEEPYETYEWPMVSDSSNSSEYVEEYYLEEQY